MVAVRDDVEASAGGFGVPRAGVEESKLTEELVLLLAGELVLLPPKELSNTAAASVMPKSWSSMQV